MPPSVKMALASGHSASYPSYYSARYPIHSSTSIAVHSSTVVAVKKRVNASSIAGTLIPQVTIQFQIPYTTIDMFFRSDMMVTLASRDTPPIYLALDDVPAAAVPTIRLYIESINRHAKYVSSL